MRLLNPKTNRYVNLTEQQTCIYRHLPATIDELEHLLPMWDRRDIQVALGNMAQVNLVDHGPVLNLVKDPKKPGRPREVKVWYGRPAPGHKPARAYVNNFTHHLEKFLEENEQDLSNRDTYHRFCQAYKRLATEAGHMYTHLMWKGMIDADEG